MNACWQFTKSGAWLCIEIDGNCECFKTFKESIERKWVKREEYIGKSNLDQLKQKFKQSEVANGALNKVDIGKLVNDLSALVCNMELDWPDKKITENLVNSMRENLNKFASYESK